MSSSEINDKIMKDALRQFVNDDLCSAALNLLKKLGVQYTRGAQSSLPVNELFKGKSLSSTTKEALELVTNTYFVALIDNRTFDKSREDVDLASALTEAKTEKYNGLFVFAIDVKTDVIIKRNRTIFATLTRAFNKLAYDKPVILLIRQSENLSIATCERIDKKRDAGEKMGKVNLLQNINCARPATGHLRILESLQINSKIKTFDALYEHWFEVFNTKTLTDKFYKELYNWYMWVVNDPNTHFPENGHLPEHENEKKNVKIIRLITRLLFVWFIKEKKVKKEGQPEIGLVPEKLFEIGELKDILNDFDPYSETNGEFYNAILQNLFFATLNNEVNSRQFVDTSNAYRSKKGYTVKNLYRDNKGEGKSWFKISHDEVLNLFKTVPFLNCGLFECLDKYKRTDISYDVDRLFDGFSTKSGDKFRACLPNRLFFADELPEITIQVTEKKKKVPLKIKSKGLINLLNEYVFTVEENTPLDQQVSLDPELLGKVFENLLAAYNPETEESARKSSGSYYTPREIVEYMVNESLIQYLKTNLNADEATEKQLRNLVSPNNPDFNLNSKQQDAILEALYHCKILDPACGSGAFPMGMLQQMVHIISRLDEDNSKWQALITKKATEETTKAFENKELSDKDRKAAIAEIANSFTNSKNNPDYTRKLYLIQNCIFGVDIQPIAMMISKLRFFISLICEQDENAIDFNEVKQNFGIHTLPNLETKFVAANSLLTPDVKKFTGDWTNDEHLDKLKDELMELRYRHVTARSLKEKMQIRTLDDDKRQEINDYILSTQAHADPVKIAMFEDQIAHLMLERRLYEGENIVEEYVAEQGDLFGNAEPKLVRKDTNRAKRDEIDRQIRVCQAQIDHEKAKENITGFAAAVKQLTEWNPYDQVKSSPFFDPDWMFGITDGFDIVIGNPPYKQIPKNVYSIQMFPFSEGKDVGKQNLYKLFVEHSYNLAKEETGVACMIVQSSLMCDLSSKHTRELILKKTKLGFIIEFPKKAPTIEGQVFESVCQGTCIYLFQKLLPDDSPFSISVNNDCTTLSKLNVELIRQSLLISFYPEDYAIPLLKKGDFNVLKKIKSNSQKLSDYVIDVVQGDLNLTTAKNEIRNYNTGVKLLRGKNVSSYKIDYNVDEYINKSYRSQYVQQNRKKIFILCQEVTGTVDPRRINCCTSTIEENFICGHTINKLEVIEPNNNILLMGLLNSKIMDWVFRKTSSNNHVGGYELKQLPILIPKNIDLFNNLIKDIVVTKELGKDSTDKEEQLDVLIYKLYGLTFSEIQIVDPDFKLSKESYEKLLTEE